MLTRLGAPAAPNDAVDLLLECHDRIRAFLGLAGRLGEARGEPEGVVMDAAGRVHRYFAQALPLHALDEEESIAPRLRGRERAVDVELATMVREHREHEAPLALLLEACAQLAREPARHAELGAVVRRASGELQRHFAPHLAREEEVVFPAVRRLLDAPADAAIVKEIRLRRGVAAEAPAAAGRSRAPGIR